MQSKKHAAVLIGACLLSAAGSANAETAARWRWLEDTYWYVPANNLPAYVFMADSRTLLPVSDQTVFHITGYADGYFWGKTAAKLATKLDAVPVNCTSLVGSVTPEGRVFLTFTPVDLSNGGSVTQGIGQMVKKAGQWTMENQMSTGSPQRQVGHWAYMVQTGPGKKNWRSLPGLDVSVEEFLAQCPDGPRPVTAVSSAP